MAPPLISIIMPYYNAARFFAEAIASIRAQDYAPCEILVVDDGSQTDERDFIRAQDRRIIYMKQENKGPAAARNRALAEARGALIAFLDADDLWPDNKLSSQLALLQAAPGRMLVSGRIRYIWEDGIKDQPLQLEADDTLHHVHLGAMLARKEAFVRTGAFNEELRFSEDHDWWLRAREVNLPMAISDDVTLLYRRHKDNMTRHKTVHDVGLLRVLKHSLDRRRRAGVSGDLAAFLPPKKEGYRD